MIPVILQIELRLSYREIAVFLSSERSQVLRAITLPLFNHPDGDVYDNITVYFYRETELPYVPGKGEILHFKLNPAKPPSAGFYDHAAFSVKTVEWLDSRKRVFIELSDDGTGDPVIPFNLESTDWKKIEGEGDYLSNLAFKR